MFIEQIVAPILLCIARREKKLKSMSIEQNATQWVETVLQGQISATKRRKSVKLDRSRRLGRRSEQPLNILGCLALIHAVRSADSGERMRVRARRTTTA